MPRDISQIIDIAIDTDQMDTTPHGSREFPVAVYFDVLKNNVLGYVNWHWHAELQISVVAEGRVSFYIGGERFDLEKGEGIFINSRVLHMIKPLTEDAAFICLNYSTVLLSLYPGSVFDVDYVEPFIRNSNAAAVVLRESFPCTTNSENANTKKTNDENCRGWQQYVTDCVMKIYDLYAECEGNEYDILSLLQQQWMSLIRNAEEFRSGGRKSRRMKTAVHDILDYIDDHFMEKVTIQDIAAAAAFSKSECCRMFRRELGETIFSYLKKFRVERSMHLLKNTDMSITDIAYETGFTSTSYFIKTFREIIGTTPAKYRLSCGSETDPDYPIML